MASPVVLYDIPGRHKRKQTATCFSWNIWRTRMLLNYKQVEYRTEWVEYPDLQARLAETQTPQDAWAPWTCPTVKFPDGTYIMDSNAITQAVDAHHPHPAILSGAKISEDAHGVFVSIARCLYISLAPRFIEHVLDERSAAWFAIDRARRFGMPVEQAVAANSGESVWQMLEEKPDGPLCRLVSLLTEKYTRSGPFLLGEQVSYGDFIIASFFESMKRVDPAGYERVMAFDTSFPRLHQSCYNWLVRDD